MKITRRHNAVALAAGLGIVGGVSSASRAAATWIGGNSTSLIDSANWANGTLPLFSASSNTAANDAIFDGNNTLVVVPNSGIVDTYFRNITFAPTAGAFTFVDDGSANSEIGNLVNKTTAGIYNNLSPNTQTFSEAQFTFEIGQILATNGDFVFNTAPNIGVFANRTGNTIVFGGDHNIYLNQGLTGVAIASKTGAGTLFIAGPSTGYIGKMSITSGFVQINDPNSLGSVGDASTGYTEVTGNTGGLVLTNNITVGEFTYMFGRSTFDAQIFNKSGHNVVNGVIQAETVGTDYTVESDGTAAGDLLEIGSQSLIELPAVFGTATFALRGAGNGLINAPFLDAPSSNPATNQAWNLVKMDSGTWELNSPQGHGGTTVVQQGKLVIDSSAPLANTPSIAVNSGAILDVTPAGGLSLSGTQTLKGAGSVLGTITTNNGSIIAPGDSGAGTLTVGGLSLNDGTILQYEFAPTPAGASDDIHVTGNLSLSGTTTMSLSVIGGGAAVGTYRIFDYDGSLSGGTSNLHIANVSSAPAGTTRQTFLFDSSTAHQINLTIGGAPAANLTWVGGVSSNAWDLKTTVNFTGDTEATPDNRFFNGDSVTFNDSGANIPTINIVGSLVPAKLTFANSAAHPYKFSGGDVIVGGNLTIGGAGAVTFSNGAVSVTGNVVASGAGDLTFANSDINVTGNVTASNAGTLTIGNSGNGTFAGGVGVSDARSLTVSSGTNTIGGNLSVSGTGAINLTGGSLTVAGSFAPTNTGGLNISNGDLTVGGNFALVQNGGNITIANSGALSPVASLAMNGGTVDFNRGGNSTAGAVTGTGIFRQDGSGTTLLTGNNSGYAGTFIVANGVLKLDQGSVNGLGTPAVDGATAASTTILSGATLDLNGKADNISQVITVGGTGASGQLGALVDTSGRGTAGVNRSRTEGLILTADTTIYAAANTFPYIADSNDAVGVLQGNGHNFTIAGAGEWDLVDLGETNLANITIKDGLGGDGIYWRGTTTFGAPTGVITLQNDGLLVVQSSSSPISKPMVVATDGSGHAGLGAAGGNETIDSPVTLNGTLDTLAYAGNTLTLTGKLTGPGGLTAHGTTTGTVALTNGTNDFAGPITIGGGYGSGFGLIKPANDKVVLSIGNGGTTGVLPAGNITINAASALAFNNATTYNFPNNISGAGNVTAMAGAVSLTGSLTYTGATTVNGGLLRTVSSIATSSGVTVNATGTFEAPNTQTLGAITVNDGGKAKIDAGTAGAKNVLSVGNNTRDGVVVFSGSGVLDVSNDAMVVVYAVGDTSPASTIQAYLATGYNGGTWDGVGIDSSAAHGDGSKLTALGMGEATDLGITSVDGVSVSNAVIVKYTYYGDSSLDGKVDLGNDFNLFLQGFLGGGSTWELGDYNYDGKVDSSDFALFVQGYANQGGQLGELDDVIADSGELSAVQKASLLSVVPEPSSVMLLGIAAASLTARRRRKQSPQNMNEPCA